MKPEGNKPWGGFLKKTGEIRSMDFPFSLFDREQPFTRATSWVSLGALVWASCLRLLCRPER